MPNMQLFPAPVNLLTVATLTTSGTGSAITIPMASSYRISLQANTVSGTSPTLDVSLFTSLDGGNTYVGFLHFAQMTTSGAGQQVIIKPYLGPTEVATTAVAPLLGTADFTAGTSAVYPNGPIDPRYIKVRYVLSGTSPSFSSVAVNLLAVSQDSAD